MSLLKDLLAGRPLPKRELKPKAHFFTLLSVVWLMATLAGVVLVTFETGVDPELSWTIAVGLWVLQAVFVGLAIRFWLREAPKEVTMIYNDAEGE